MKKLHNQAGIIRILPLLLIVAAVGIISFLLISSTAPLKNGIFNSTNPKPASHAAATNSFTGEYWNAGTGSSPGIPTTTPNLTRTETSINFDWGTGSPDPAINVDHFIVRWTGSFDFVANNYDFNMTSDDGSRLYIDNQLIINAWYDQGPVLHSFSVPISAGTHQIRMEYYENTIGATAKLNWNVHVGPMWNPVGITNYPAGCNDSIGQMNATTGNMILAGVNHNGVWASNDSGATWAKLPGSSNIINDDFWLTSDPANPSIIWESGVHWGGAVYRSKDGGDTFQQLGSFSQSDFVSYDPTDPNRNLVLAGSHEQAQTVWKSTDGGTTFTNIGANLPAGTNFSTTPLAINAQTYVVNTAGYLSATSGMWQTTDGGATWHMTSTMGPSGAPKAPLLTKNGIVYWPFGSGLMKSTDKGATWTNVGSGLQDMHPMELPDGRLVSASSDHLMISSDGGVTWSQIGPATPYAPGGVIYSASRKAFFIWNGDCLPSQYSVLKLDYDFGPSPSPSPTPASSTTPQPTSTPTTLPSPSTSSGPTASPSVCQGADIDNSGKVDIFDFNTLVTNFGKTGVGQSGGDIDGSGKVDIFDFNTLVTNFGRTGC